MAGTFKFDLVSPERVLMSEAAEEVLVPGADGDFTVLASHAPVIAMLRPGVISAKLAGGKTTRLFVMGGFAEVLPDSLTVLAERAMPVDAMDAAVVARETRAAEAELAAATTDEARHIATSALETLKGLGTRVA
jgi:F-type H+-transporting ATPase subunit epsilon